MTTIKLSSQIIIKNYADKLDSKVLAMFKKINDQALNLESKINLILKGIEAESNYDILIVEDNPEFVDVLEILFDLANLKIKCVNSGKKGLEELTLNIPKLVLLDILLPDIDGYEVCKSIKADDKFKNVLVYYMTAVPESEVKKHMTDTRADGYFLKPLDDNFADAVKKILKI